MRILTNWLASRPRKHACTTVVLHATAGSSVAGALAALRDRELSYHYIIAKAGEVTKAVPASRVAFHAGKSVGPDGAGVNEYSIGISFVNLNDGHDPYTAKQTLEAILIVRELRKQFPELRYVTTHARVSPGRKTDPRGYDLFGFAAKAGLIAW